MNYRAFICLLQFFVNGAVKVHVPSTRSTQNEGALRYDDLTQNNASSQQNASFDGVYQCPPGTTCEYQGCGFIVLAMQPAWVQTAITLSKTLHDMKLEETCGGGVHIDLYVDDYQTVRKALVNYAEVAVWYIAHLGPSLSFGNLTHQYARNIANLRLQKIRAIHRSPYAKTIYMDAEISPCGAAGLKSVLEEASGSHIFSQKAPLRYSASSGDPNYPPLPKGMVPKAYARYRHFRERNGGFLILDKKHDSQDAVNSMVANWEDYFMQGVNDGTNQQGRDQASLRKALFLAKNELTERTCDSKKCCRNMKEFSCADGCYFVHNTFDKPAGEEGSE